MKAAEANALMVVDDRVLNGNASRIAELAQEHRIPTIGERSHVTAGALMAYGVDLRQFWFQSATFIDKVLRGAKPADLPVQQATRFEFIVNTRTAKALDLEIPPTVLARADEVIE